MYIYKLRSSIFGVIQLPNNTITSLGRSDYADIQVIDPYVSRIQFLIDTTKHPPLLIDGNGSATSKNGTTVNRIVYGGIYSPIRKSLQLKNNDIITIGSITIQFEDTELSSDIVDPHETR